MSPFGVFQDFHSLSFCSLEGVRTLTPAGAEPPGGAIKEVRKPGLGMETQVCLWVVCPLPNSSGQAPGHVLQVVRPKRPLWNPQPRWQHLPPLKVKREELTHLCSPSHPQSPVFPGSGMSFYEAKLHVTSESWFTLTFIPSLFHYRNISYSLLSPI